MELFSYTSRLTHDGSRIAKAILKELKKNELFKVQKMISNERHQLNYIKGVSKEDGNVHSIKREILTLIPELFTDNYQFAVLFAESVPPFGFRLEFMLSAEQSHYGVFCFYVKIKEIKANSAAVGRVLITEYNS
jgi:hypothetical protein